MKQFNYSADRSLIIEEISQFLASFQIHTIKEKELQEKLASKFQIVSALFQSVQNAEKEKEESLNQINSSIHQTKQQLEKIQYEKENTQKQLEQQEKTLEQMKNDIIVYAKQINSQEKLMEIIEQNKIIQEEIMSLKQNQVEEIEKIELQKNEMTRLTNKSECIQQNMDGMESKIKLWKTLNNKQGIDSEIMKQKVFIHEIKCEIEQLNNEIENIRNSGKQNPQLDEGKIESEICRLLMEDRRQQNNLQNVSEIVDDLSTQLEKEEIQNNLFKQQLNQYLNKQQLTK